MIKKTNTNELIVPKANKKRRIVLLAILNSMTISKEIVWIKIIQRMDQFFKDNNLNNLIKLNKFQ